MSDKNKGRLLKNAVSNWVPLMINMVLGFVVTPMLINHLGKDRYGVWMLVVSFIGYYGLLRFGISSGVMRYVPYYSGREQKKQANEIINTSLAVFTLVGLIIVFISFLGAKSIADFYGGGREFVILVRVLGLAAAFECPMRILDACLRAHEKWVKANLVTVSTAISRTGGLMLCVVLSTGLTSMSFVVLGVTLLSVFLMLLFVKMYCKDVIFSFNLIKPAHLKSLLSFGFLTTVITLVTTMRFHGHKLIIGKVISLEAVGIYAVAVLLLKNLKALVVAPNRVFWPRFSFLHGGNKRDKLVELFGRGIHVNAVFSSMVCMFIMLAGIPFIKLWVGEGFESVYTAFLILGVASLVENTFVVTGSFMAVTGYQNIHAIFSVIEGIVGLALYIILGIKFGLTGIAVGTLLAVGFIRGFACPYFICRKYDLKLHSVYRKSILRPWLVLLMFVITGFYLGVSDWMTSWMSFFGYSILLGVFYLAGIYVFGMDKESRDILNDKVYELIQNFVNKPVDKKESIPEVKEPVEIIYSGTKAK